MIQDPGVFGVDRPPGISFLFTPFPVQLALYLSKKIFLFGTNLIDFLLTYAIFHSSILLPRDDLFFCHTMSGS